MDNELEDKIDELNEEVVDEPDSEDEGEEEGLDATITATASDDELEVVGLDVLADGGMTPSFGPTGIAAPFAAEVVDTMDMLVVVDEATYIGGDMASMTAIAPMNAEPSHIHWQSHWPSASNVPKP